MSRPQQPPDLRLLSKVSKLYYEQGLTQNDIAERLHLSRPKVSRLLQQALDEGVVQIKVQPPPEVYAALEQQLESKFGLQEAVVVHVESHTSEGETIREVGSAAASYLQRTLEGGDVIGVSWGTTLNAMVNALRPTEAQNVHVVQIIGGLGPPEAHVHATDLCRRMSHVLNSRLTLLPASGIVDSAKVKQALLSDSHIQTAFEAFPKINVAYVGIGAPTPGSILLQDGMIISRTALNELLAAGAVGDIALRFFDACGAPLLSELDDRVVGITLEQLKQVERVIGVVGGVHKQAVVCAALAGKMLDVLIVDQALATCLLECTPCAEGSLDGR